MRVARCPEPGLPLMPPEESTLKSVDETARRKFESARRKGAPATIEDHLPATADPRYLPTLEELVYIDLEVGWKGGGSTPRVEDYVARFPRLSDPAILLRLLRQEYRVRHQFGDRPSWNEYVARFPAIGASAAQIETLAPLRTITDHVPPIPGYELLEPLGRGGMGIVHKARQVGLNRLVALKLFRDGGADAVDLARFQTEAEAIARLRHPNIVQVYEVGTAEGRPYIALEFVAGGSLDRAIAGIPQPPRVAAALVEHLARAVHVAHLAGILHRDLKPANVLLELTGTGSDVADLSSVFPKVADFGLAKRLHADAGQTQAGTVLGTPSYMAPEQAAGRADVGPAADVYGLGGILYELLTGRPPFRAATSFDTLSQVLYDDPVPPSRLLPNVARDLETICLKCLRKDPGLRYGTAVELAEDLHRFLAGEPIRARPVRSWERAVKWARRRPTAAGLVAAAIVAVLAVVGGVVALYFNGQLQSALALAETSRDEADVQRRNADEQRALAVTQRLAAESSEQEADRQRVEADRQRALAQRYQYQAHVHLAHRAVEDGDLPRALELLDRYRPETPDDPDFRGFEWHYVRRLTRNLHALRGHNEDAVDVAFAPDGRTVASAGWDNTVRIWDAIAGVHRITRTFKHSEPGLKVHGLAFNRSGKRLGVTAGTIVTVFDTVTWKETVTLTGHTDHVGGVAFSPDGERIATASSDGTAGLWDATSGKKLFALTGEKDEMVRRVAFSPDGTALAWASAFVDRGLQKEIGGAVKVWDLKTRKATVSRKWDGRGANDISFDTRGRRLAVADGGGDVRVLTLPDGEETLRFHAHEKGANAVRFSPDGTRLASAGYDLTVRMWNAADGKEHDVLKGHTGRGTQIQLRGLPGVNQVAFSPDGTRLASVGDDRAVMIWNVAPAFDPLPPPPLNPENSVTRLVVEYGHKPRDLVTVWDLKTGRDLLSFRPAVDDKLTRSPDGRWLLALNKTAKLWDLATGRETKTAGGHTNRISRAVMSPDGRFLATTAGTGDFSGRAPTLADYEVNVWDTASGRWVWNLRGHTWVVRGIAWRHDGALLATTGQDGTLRVWDMVTGKPRATLTGHSGTVYAVSFSPDGNRLATGGEDRIVRVWDVPTGEEVLTLKGHGEHVWAVEFGPDGRYLVSRSGPSFRTATRKVWDARPPDR